jgi:hypothetical protein
VTFDADTDLGGAAATGGCSAFFEAETAAAAGAGASCVWANDKTLAIFFGKSSTMMPGVTAVALKAGVVKNKIGNSFTASGTVIVASPSTKRPPVAAISAAQTVGPCDGVLLDGSASEGGGGRPMTYAFGVVAANADASAVAAAITLAAAAASANGGASSAVLALAAKDLAPGVTYTFSVKVTDFAGGSSVGTPYKLTSQLIHSFKAPGFNPKAPGFNP